MARAPIATVVMGAGVNDRLRGVIAAVRPDPCIRVTDRASGPAGLGPFARRVVRAELPGEPA